ncbi:MAG: hypothetical protein FOGNACKC_02483 [Anaerolineae bacterium]|nr:hypothetical protein [Anaerolineae bacterium]
MNLVETPISTFSIVGRCVQTGMLGVAIASKYPAVGAVCSHTRPGVGAIATQAYGNPYLGFDGLDLLSRGKNVESTLAQLLRQDAGREKRQVIIIDQHGQTAAHTGNMAAAWAGHLQATDCAAAGNILAGPQVIQVMVDAFEQAPGEELAERLLRALEAGDRAGGDKRGKQAAHLQVVHVETWKYVDLRVDDHPEPVAELRRLFELAKTELFPFRDLYPTRDDPGADWDLDDVARLSPPMVGRQ